ncbi:esterase FrsA [Catenulispora sp. GAS73]|uniref:alpha/beta hydrolase n=1 Tax=Catenulispora sp. GAS73 TaxID=3156269 RepID=UPI0035117CC0
MNDIAELKQYVLAHARIQGIPRAQYRAVLDRIRTDDEGAPDSWAVQWTRAGEELQRAGKSLEAVRMFNMGRFPYVDGPARLAALNACVESFDGWRKQNSTIEEIQAEAPGGRLRCWADGLSAEAPRPVALVLGGIVSVKEQWAPLLPLLKRQGFAGVVAEMPGVGENALRYTPESWRMLSCVLDSIKDRAQVADTYAICLSFSGHMALRCALEDPRIRAVITVGAPVSDFFTDVAWLHGVPRVTIDTLGHISGMPDAAADGRLSPWALSTEQLAALDVPVHYLASKRDEIIPPGDVKVLRKHVANLHLAENDDVHGSPEHAAESRLWVVNSLLHAHGEKGARVRALRAMLALARLRGKLGRARS